jgi:hypothetical protein
LLNELIGRTPLEVGKSIALGVLALVTAVALLQLAAERTQGRQGDRGRTEVASTARDFALALSTYDYAHPDVQRHRLAAVALPQVVEKVRSAEPDLQQYQASSIGQTPDVWVQDFNGSSARVLIRTKSTMQSTFAPPGTRASGLVSCQVEQRSGAWRVTDYQWLTPATETNPGYTG